MKQIDLVHTKKKKTLLSNMRFGILFVFFTAILLIPKNSLTQSVDLFALLPKLPLEELRVSAYTKEFAKRFGLPMPEKGTEPTGGLEAIEFAIEKTRFAPLYSCSFYLYVDNRLPIKYPEDRNIGEKHMLISTTHFFGRTREQWLKWSNQDRIYSSRQLRKYNMKAYLATMNYVPGKQGAINSMDYLGFYREILPSLAYIKLGDSPSNSLMSGRKRKNMGVWLQKEIKTGYRSHIYVDPGEFIRFEIPSFLLTKIQEFALVAEKANDVVHRAEYKANREAWRKKKK